MISPSTPAAAHPPEPGALKRLIAKPEFGPLVLLVAMVVVFTAINPTFMSLNNIGNALTFTVELGLIALAMTLLMTAGEFDLSVGSTVTLVVAVPSAPSCRNTSRVSPHIGLSPCAWRAGGGSLRKFLGDRP